LVSVSVTDWPVVKGVGAMSDVHSELPTFQTAFGALQLCATRPQLAVPVWLSEPLLHA
jgi:hypothetical protein